MARATSFGDSGPYLNIMIKDISKIIDKIKNSQSTLYILCGFPYSGKSYIAKELVKETNITVVSIDDIFYSKGFSWDDNRLPHAEGWKEIFDISYIQSQDALKIGKNVLYDSTNHTKESRNELRKVALSVNAETVVIYIQAPVETIWERWEENIKTKERSVVSKELVQMTIDSFEIPDTDENVLII